MNFENIDAKARMRLMAEKDIEAGDLYVDWFDKTASDGDFLTMQYVLQNFAFTEEITPKVLSGILMISKHVKNHLGSARDTFYENCVSFLKQNYDSDFKEGKFDNMLKRLK